MLKPVFQIYGVQLEIAQPGQTQPTPLEKIDPADNIRRCQRFYEVINIAPDFTSTITTTYLMRPYRFAVTKRAAPTITYSNMQYYQNGTWVAFTPTNFGTTGDMTSLGSNSLTSANGIATGAIMASADL